MALPNDNCFQMIDELMRDPFFTDRIRHVETIEPKEGRSFPLDKLEGMVNERLLGAYGKSGVTNLYHHQFEAIDSILHGNDVVVATPTSSGKTLVYNLCVLDSFLSNPSTHALYVFPLKALAQDQMKNLGGMSDLLGIPLSEVAAVYDGDTPGHMRKQIMDRPPAIVITNPDMLHFSLLSNHDKWTRFLTGLKYIIVDEVHTYRGVFGSNVANVFRRLARILKGLGVKYRYICTSATMSHTKEFARTLFSRDFDVIERSSTQSTRKHFIFLNPQIDGATSSSSPSPSTTARNLLAKFVRKGIRTICFTQSRRLAELIAKWTRDELGEELRDRVEPYRAGYLPEERRKIEKRMASGELLGIVSTSALELGIDIGYLESCILLGYPGTMISTWQRAGRVGRMGSKGEAYISFISGRDALDQYFVNHSKEFFTSNWEKAVIDPDNQNILKPHIICAAREMPVSEDEVGTSNLFPLTAVFALRSERKLRKDPEQKGLVTDIYRPHRRLNIRNMGISFRIVREDGKQVGEIDDRRVFHECHSEAIYMHQGVNYVVRDLDLLDHTAKVARTKSVNHTSPMVEKKISVIRSLEGRRYGNLKIFFGDMKIEEQVTGYYEKTPGPKSSVILEKVFDEPMPKQVLRTKGVWFTLPYGLADEIREKFGGDPWETVFSPRPVIVTETFAGALHGAEHNLISILPVFAMCDRWDVGGLSTARHPDTLLPTIFVYDAIEGGVGFAERGYEMFEEWARAGSRSLAECKCVEENGCPSCIQSPKCGNDNAPLHRKAAEHVMDLVLKELQGSEETTIDPKEQGVKKTTEETPVKPVTEEFPLEPAAGESSGRTEELLEKGVIVFDLETEYLAHEVGGWGNIRGMGLSVAVTLDTGTGEYTTYYKSDVDKLFAVLYDAPLVVGFNLYNFDWEVLAGFPGFDRTRINALDLFNVVRERTRRKIALNNLGKHNVGMEKSGDGFKAIEWLRSGQMDKLEAYCRRDVEITYNLFVHMLDKGKVSFEVPEFEHVIEVETDVWKNIERLAGWDVTAGRTE